MTTIDFNALMEEAGEGFQPIPPGPYTVEVCKAELTTSSTQKPMIRAQLKILGGPHNGRIVFDQYTLSAGNPRALGFYFDTMAALGLNREYFASNPSMEAVAQTLLGRQCNVQVSMKQYQGVDRNEVKNYRPVQGGAPVAQASMVGVPQMGGAMPMAPGQGVPQMAPQQQMPQMQQMPPQQPQPMPQMQPQPQPQQMPQEWPQQVAQTPEQQPQPMPVQQPAQPQAEAPMWQPTAGPDQQPQQAPQQYQQPVPQPPAGGAPPMPQVPGPERTI